VSELRKGKHGKELGIEKFARNDNDRAHELKPTIKRPDDKKKDISIKLSLKDLIELLHPNSDNFDMDAGDNPSRKEQPDEH